MDPMRHSTLGTPGLLSCCRVHTRGEQQQRREVSRRGGSSCGGRDAGAVRRSTIYENGVAGAGLWGGNASVKKRDEKAG